MSTPVSGSSSTPSSQATLSALLAQSAPSASTGAPISFGGLVSGLNTQAIIQALLTADQAPIVQLQSEQAREQAKLSAWQDLNTKLGALQAAADTLGLQGSVSAKQVSFAGPSGTFASGTASPNTPTGSFQLQIDQLATATQVKSTAGVGAAILGTDVMSTNSKLSTPVTSGTFTVGVTDPVSHLVTNHQISITTGEDFNTVLADVNTQTSGAVSGSVVGNTIQLTSNNGQPITLGSSGDSSNFLSVVKLLGQPSATTMTSSGPVGVANPNVALDQGNINGFTTGTTNGTLAVNGVTINYNSTTDSLNTVLNRINASAAGVTATYDPVSDTVTVASAGTGNVDISLADGTGNLLSSLNVTAAGAHHLGQSAKYEVNGGTAQYSLSNTVNNLVPGVNVTLQSVTTGGPITGSISLNNTVGTNAVQAFVTAYNSVVDTITQDTAFDTNTKVAGIFLGDPTVTSIQQQLDQGLFISNGVSQGLTPPYTDISTIGLSTGPVGSQPGTTTDLQFDASTFQAALSANPSAVTNLANTVFSQLSKTTLSIVQPFGLVDSAIQGETQQITDFQNEIFAQNLILQQQQALLTTEFSNLDTALANLQSQSAAGASVLASLAAQTTTTSTTPTSTSA